MMSSLRQKPIFDYNMKLVAFFTIFISGLLSGSVLYGQEEMPLSWKKDLLIDADFSDWQEDSLSYSYEEQGLSYSIANDDKYLYVFIQVPHPGQQLKAIYNGFNITLNPDAKEKPGPSVIFPLPDRAALRAVNEESDPDKVVDRRQFGLETVRAIYVRDFNNIVDGMISTKNNYGIQTSVRIDSADVLNYEMAIRLDQLELKSHAPFAINLRINEIITTRYTDPGYRRYRYGYPYYYGRDPYGRSMPRSGISRKEVPGSWHIVTLANN